MNESERVNAGTGVGDRFAVLAMTKYALRAQEGYRLRR